MRAWDHINLAGDYTSRANKLDGSSARTSRRSGLSVRRSAPLEEFPPHGQAKENPT